MIREVELGNQAFEYLKEMLVLGSRFTENTSLSSCLLNLPLYEEKIVTYCLSNINISEKSDLSDGFSSRPITNLKEVRKKGIDIIYQYLDSTPLGYVVFETFARVGDKVLEKLDIPLFSHNKDIYYFLRTTENDRKKIENSLKSARHYPLICSLSSLTEIINYSNHVEEVELKTLENLAFRTKKIIIDAYDGDSFIVWERMGKSNKEF